jgi:hypothetical protein
MREGRAGQQLLLPAVAAVVEAAVHRRAGRLVAVLAAVGAVAGWGRVRVAWVQWAEALPRLGLHLERPLVLLWLLLALEGECTTALLQ